MDIPSNNVALFGNARTALKYGLLACGVAAGDRLLAPDFVCDTVLHPLAELKVAADFYRIDDKLSPDWVQLSSIATRAKSRGLILVHYFGQPQLISRYREFCVAHNMLLIEDNAHGHGGELNGQRLGTFGDIGISSPRKILRTPSGGILYVNAPTNPAVAINAGGYRLPGITDLLSACIAGYLPCVTTVLRMLRDSHTDWSRPEQFAETPVNERPIDAYSRRRILRTRWAEVAQQRRQNWNAWSDFTSTRGLSPVFGRPHPESCPWAFPAYARNLEERNKWLKWGVASGYAVFPWPSLPKSAIDEGGSTLSRWKRLVCFALHQGPPPVTSKASLLTW